MSCCHFCNTVCAVAVCSVSDEFIKLLRHILDELLVLLILDRLSDGERRILDVPSALLEVHRPASSLLDLELVLRLRTSPLRVLLILRRVRVRSDDGIRQPSVDRRLRVLSEGERGDGHFVDGLQEGLVREQTLLQAGVEEVVVQTEDLEEENWRKRIENEQQSQDTRSTDAIDGVVVDLVYRCDLHERLFQLMPVRFEHLDHDVVRHRREEVQHPMAQAVGVMVLAIDEVQLLQRLMRRPAPIQLPLRMLDREQMPEKELILREGLLREDQGERPAHAVGQLERLVTFQELVALRGNQSGLLLRCGSCRSIFSSRRSSSTSSRRRDRVDELQLLDEVERLDLTAEIPTVRIDRRPTTPQCQLEMRA